MEDTRELPTAFHVIGDAFVDLLSFLDGDWPENGGDSCLSEPVQCLVGGSSFNTATHLNSLIQSRGQEGVQVVLHSVWNPNDQYGRLLIQHAKEHDFKCVNCRQGDDASATGHCIVVVSGGERSFMTHRGSLAKFTADLIQVDQIVGADRPIHLHVAGFFNLEGFWNGKLKQRLDRIRVERKKRFPGVSTTISLVTQHDASHEWDGGLCDLLPCLDFLILNELEASRIIYRGHSTIELRAGSNESSVIADTISFFSRLSPQTCVVVTRGAGGATCFRNREIVASLSPAVKVTVVDPTGAGDSFAAGFLYGIWNAKRSHKDWEKQDELWPALAIKEGLQWGCAAGTAAVSIRGASIPSKIDAVVDLLAKQKN